MRDGGADIPNSSPALLRRTQWNRSSTRRGTMPTSTLPRRNSAADACTRLALRELRGPVTKSGPSDGQVKVRVPLLGTARKSGFESETLWAEPLGGNRYRIWNLPVFAYNLDMRAVVECREDPSGGMPIVTRVVEQGDCHVLRLFFNEAATEAEIQAVLDLLGARRALF